MMRDMHLLLSLLFFSASLAAAPWARLAGGVGHEDFRDLEVNSSGDRIAVGYTVTDNRVDGWLVVHDPVGKLLWQKTLRLAGGPVYAYDITLTSDGGYVLVGYTADAAVDIWVVKLDSKYKIQWRRLIGGGGWDFASNVIQTADGGYLIAGQTASYGQGGTDGWLVRLDANGAILWQKTYGGVEGREIFSAVVERPDGTLLACGSTASFGSGDVDMWLYSLDASGEVLWARTYGGPSEDICIGMLLDPDGFIMLVGYYGYSESQAADAWILRVRPNGTMGWKKRYGGEAEDSFQGIVRSSNGNYVVAGYTQSYGSGSGDGWAMEIDRSGRAVWQRTYGGEGEEYFGGLVATPESEYMAFGNTSSYGAGGNDGWLVGVDANGVPPAGCTELSRTINSASRGVPASSRRITPSVTASSVAVLSKSMQIKKTSLPASDLCGSAEESPGVHGARRFRTRSHPAP